MWGSPNAIGPFPFWAPRGIRKTSTELISVRHHGSVIAIPRRCIVKATSLVLAILPRCCGFRKWMPNGCEPNCPQVKPSAVLPLVTQISLPELKMVASISRTNHGASWTAVIRVWEADLSGLSPSALTGQAARISSLELKREAFISRPIAAQAGAQSIRV